MKRSLHKGLSVVLAAVMLMTVFTSAPFSANADTHTLEHVEKIFPTRDSNGNIEYWYCSDCGKYFSDENSENEIARSDTVLPYFTFANGGGYIKLTGYNGNDADVAVPETVPDNYPDESLRGQGFSILKESAFSGNKTITRVTIPDNVGHIAASCFANCSALAEVRIGSGLTYLGRFCFSDCTALKTIRILSRDSAFSMRLPISAWI